MNTRGRKTAIMGFVVILAVVIMLVIVNRSKKKMDVQKQGDVAASSEEVDEVSCPYNITVMPVVSIYTQTECISETKEYTETTMSFYSADGTYTAVDLEAGIRIRGNASRLFDKKSYKFKLNEKQNLYGLANGKEKVWVLLANHCDQSLLRNLTAFRLHQSFQTVEWEPNGTNVEVYLNGEYQGVYMLAEEIKVSNDRVNIDNKHPDEIDTGYLLQFSAYTAEPRFIMEAAGYEIISDVSENEDIVSQQKDYIKNYLQQCYNALRYDDYEEADALMDLDSLVACYITEEVTMNYDACWDSFYMYKDAGGKLVFGPLWDFDIAFGNDARISEEADEASYQGLFVAKGNGSLNGNKSSNWYGLALQNEWFRNRVVEIWKEYFDAICGLVDMVREEAERGKDAYDRNFQRWPLNGEPVNTEPRVILALKSHTEHAEYLASWIEKRVDWLNTEFLSERFASGESTAVESD